MQWVAVLEFLSLLQLLHCSNALILTCGAVCCIELQYIMIMIDVSALQWSMNSVFQSLQVVVYTNSTSIHSIWPSIDWASYISPGHLTLAIDMWLYTLVALLSTIMLVLMRDGMWTLQLGTPQFCFGDTSVMIWSNIVIYSWILTISSASPSKNAVSAFQISCKLLSFTLEDSWRN